MRKNNERKTLKKAFMNVHVGEKLTAKRGKSCE
jgi:hypothetical protein